MKTKHVFFVLTVYLCSKTHRPVVWLIKLQLPESFCSHRRLLGPHLPYHWYIFQCWITHLFLFLAPQSHITDIVALPQGVHTVSIEQFNGPDQPGTGAAVVQVAVGMAVVNMCAYEALLIA
jgi:hypothetical protein